MAFTVCCSRLVPLRWLTVIQHPLYHNALPLESQVQLFIVIQSFPKLYEIQCVRYIYIHTILCAEKQNWHTIQPRMTEFIDRSKKLNAYFYLYARRVQYFVTCFVFFFFFLFFLHNYFLQLQLLFYRQSLEATYINRGMWF